MLDTNEASKKIYSIYAAPESLRAAYAALKGYAPDYVRAGLQLTKYTRIPYCDDVVDSRRDCTRAAGGLSTSHTGLAHQPHSDLQDTHTDHTG